MDSTLSRSRTELLTSAMLEQEEGMQQNLMQKYHINNYYICICSLKFLSGIKNLAFALMGEIFIPQIFYLVLMITQRDNYSDKYFCNGIKGN